MNVYIFVGARATFGSSYGSGSGPIFLSNLHCTGRELSLLQCNRDMYGMRNCQHYEDAGVFCAGMRQSCMQYSTYVN